jgi:hypothetical protein
MMWESIPGSVLQTYAIISRFEDREWVQIVSLLASLLAVGAISARLSYYVDISVAQRERAGNSLSLSLEQAKKKSGKKMIVTLSFLYSSLLTLSLPSSSFPSFLSIGNFYGYVPSSKRGRQIIQGSMMGIAVSQLLARSISYALIAVSVGTRYAFLAVAFEVGAFFLYKLMRQDFYYCSWNVDGFMRALTTCFERWTVKIIADFTCFMALRNANELGGLYFR